jgi:hypothetical protein
MDETVFNLEASLLYGMFGVYFDKKNFESWSS